MTEASPKLGKIFIGGLSYETTDDKLRAYFSAYGSVTDAVVMKDPISRRSRGFGFITYADPTCVDRALAQSNHVLDNRRVEAKRAVPRADSARELSNSGVRANGSSLTSVGSSNSIGATKKIFVGGLHYETKDVDFKDYFAQYGKVVSAEVMFNRETNKSRGFGFVVFESEASVEQVLLDQNHVIDGKSVEVKRAVPRTDIPPSRSASSRTGSFNGTTGPGSVGSIDDASIGSAPSTPITPSGGSFSNGSHMMEGRSLPSPGSNGIVSGYAAAVRYGNRPLPKGPPLSSPAGFLSDTNALGESLSSLSLGDRAASSRGSGQRLYAASPTTGRSNRSSPLHVATSSSAMDTDPVMEQWKLSPSAPSQPSSDIPSLFSSSEPSTYLSQGLVSNEDSWQRSPWSQPWNNEAADQDQFSLDSDLRPPRSTSSDTPAYFSAFSNGNSRSASMPIGQNAWAPSSYHDKSSSSGAFGSGVMGMSMSLPVDHSLMEPGEHGFSSSGPLEKHAFGRGASMTLDSSGSYGSLQGFLESEYFPSSTDGSRQLEDHPKQVPATGDAGDALDFLRRSRDDDFQQQFR